MNDSNEMVNWDDIEGPAFRMFRIWCDGGELSWAKECWDHLAKSGLTGNETVLETTATYLRLVTLAQIYEEFCGYAWEENPETPIDYLTEDLEIDPVALGILAAGACPELFKEKADDYELRQAALVAVSNSQRGRIHTCLCAAYGDDIALYSRMFRTYPTASEGDEFEVNGPNSSALQYVQQGFAT